MTLTVLRASGTLRNPHRRKGPRVAACVDGSPRRPRHRRRFEQIILDTRVWSEPRITGTAQLERVIAGVEALAAADTAETPGTERLAERAGAGAIARTIV